MRSTGLEVITEIVPGEAPNRAERQAMYCNAGGGYIMLSFKDSTTTIDFDDDVELWLPSCPP